MIIDFHTHLFPDKIAEKAMKVLTEGIIKAQGSLVLEPEKGVTYDGFLKNMEENKIDLSVVLPIATTTAQSKTINDFAEKITDNEKLISFGSLHPRQENRLEVLEEIKQKGIKGIKLHPEFQDFFVDEAVVEEIVMRAKQLDLWVIFHCGVDFGYNPPVRCTPERLRRLIDKTGGENIIAAHMGGFKMWEDVEKYIVGTPVFMDTSMAADYLSPESYRRIVQNHGEDKFLFGSDYPWQGRNKALQMLLSSGLTKTAVEKIKYKNAQKILGI